jgi:hypothetical protein
MEQNDNKKRAMTVTREKGKDRQGEKGKQRKEFRI